MGRFGIDRYSEIDTATGFFPITIARGVRALDRLGDFLDMFLWLFRSHAGI